MGMETRKTPTFNGDKNIKKGDYPFGKPPQICYLDYFSSKLTS